MLSYFILGVALFAGLLLAGHWFATADPKRLAKALKWLFIGLIVTVILFFVFTGRLAWAFFALPALLPWIMRARAAARMARNFQHMAGAASGGGSGGGQGGGKASTLETRFLHMSLDHASGTMDGEVVEGPFRRTPPRRPDTGGTPDLVAGVRRGRRPSRSRCWKPISTGTSRIGGTTSGRDRNTPDRVTDTVPARGAAQ